MDLVKNSFLRDILILIAVSLVPGFAVQNFVSDTILSIVTVVSISAGFACIAYLERCGDPIRYLEVAVVFWIIDLVPALYFGDFFGWLLAFVALVGYATVGWLLAKILLKIF